ncbi:flagellar export chaperone FliS [Variovorax ginsengisoli]|uniref:Flagellar secretion chaperone FliS n=1 Tax=Variovorax ginsengisoli TaxID=363844 RepID=A0ABT9SD77_9BURK|nr:flagellar export chaperone FliS [Variovorax ginsengisoli]MDP9902305.1 flagellar protein FliS [Variovorax ginsengisoli]
MYSPLSHRTGAGAYARLGIETTVMSASPHQLITMLFEGAATAIGLARHYMAVGDIPAKSKAISKAIGIVEDGLKASLDAEAAGPEGAALVANLTELYDCVVQRLLYANLRNDPQWLDQAEELLENVASAWRSIGQTANA